MRQVAEHQNKTGRDTVNTPGRSLGSQGRGLVLSCAMLPRTVKTSDAHLAVRRWIHVLMCEQ